MRSTRLFNKKTLLLAILLAGVSLVHFLTPIDGHRRHLIHIVAQKLFILPISLGALWYGFAGGLLTALFSSVLFLSHVSIDWRGQIGENLNQYSELVTFFVVGLGTGAFVRLEEKLKRDAAKERQRAETDPLTRLLNRNYFETHFSREIQRATLHGYPLALCLIDLDGFKKINDTWGHPAGDRALIHLSETVRRLKRRGDIAIRFGGDEFLVILPGAEASEASEWGKRLQRALSGGPFHPESSAEPLVLSASIGVTELCPESDAPEDLIRRADEALYASKKNKEAKL